MFFISYTISKKITYFLSKLLFILIFLFLFDRYQKGKLMLLASLSCWIIFTLPLGFIQPPVTTCMIQKNSSCYLAAPVNSKGPRIVKRSINNDEFSAATEDTDYLEVAANVVFERLRRSADDHLLVYQHSLPLGGTSYNLNKLPPLSELVAEASNYKQGLQDKIKRQAPSQSPDNDSTNLRYEQFIVDDATDDTAHGIDIDSIAQKNRPADVLEYKRFLKVSTVRNFLSNFAEKI